MTDVIWKVYPHCSDYIVTTCGRIRRINSRSDMKPYHHNGYLRLSLTINGTRIHKFVHTIIAETFLPTKLQEHTSVNHIDNNTKNNHINNLEWSSHKEQAFHKVKTGRTISTKVVVRLDENNVQIERHECAKDAAAFHGINISTMRNYIQIPRKFKGTSFVNLVKSQTPTSLEGEIWKNITVDQDDVDVHVSNLGRIRKKHGIVNFTRKDQHYYSVMLIVQGKSKNFSVHILVANAFIPRADEDGCTIDHISGDRYDNRACNLEWVT